MSSLTLILLLLLSGLLESVYAFDNTNKSGVQATVLDPSALGRAVYHHHFWKYDTVSNMPWDCGGNSYDLFLWMKKAGALGQQNKVFIAHIFYEKDFKLDSKNRPLSRMLVPLRPRAGYDKWAFHAFLIIDGFVYDQYFTNQPKILDFDRYIQEMWGRENQDAFKFQIIPVTQYHEIAAQGYSVDIAFYPIMNFKQVDEILER